MLTYVVHVLLLARFLAEETPFVQPVCVLLEFASPLNLYTT